MKFNSTLPLNACARRWAWQVWDVTAGACSETLRYHSDKVQSVAWNGAQATVLLSAGYDRAACMV